MSGWLISLKRQMHSCSHRAHQCLLLWTRPTSHSLLGGTRTDLARTRAELLAENALLRQQLIILSRQVKRPTCTKTDRILLVVLAWAVSSWKQALFIFRSLFARLVSSTGITLLALTRTASAFWGVCVASA